MRKDRAFDRRVGAVSVSISNLEIQVKAEIPIRYSFGLFFASSSSSSGVSGADVI